MTTPEDQALAAAHAADVAVVGTYAAYTEATRARAQAFAALNKLPGWSTAKIAKEFGMARSRAHQIIEMADRPERRQP